MTILTALTAARLMLKGVDWRKKIALWIGYGLLLTVIVTTVLVINLRHRVKETELQNQLLTKDFDTLREANDSLALSFKTITTLRDIDSRMIANLGEDLGEQRVSQERFRSRLTQLEFDNASVRQFLDTPSPVVSDRIPSCVLDDSCKAGGKN